MLVLVIILRFKYVYYLVMIINVQLKANINCSMTTAKVYSGKNSTTTTTDRPWFIFTLFSRQSVQIPHTLYATNIWNNLTNYHWKKESIIKVMAGIHLVLAIPSHYRHYPVKAIALFGNYYTRTKTYSMDFFVRLMLRIEPRQASKLFQSLFVGICFPMGTQHVMTHVENICLFCGQNYGYA